MKGNRGSYFFSFFTVELDDVDLDKLGPDVDLKEVLRREDIVHELFHYIQDVSTTLGLAHTEHIANLIAKQYLLPIAEKQHYPVILNDETSVINKDLFSIYSRKNVSASVPKHADFELAWEDLGPFDDAGKYSLREFKVLASVDGVSNEYLFNSMSLFEGMAWIFERHVCGSAEEKFIEVPYDLPLIVSKIRCASIGLDERFVFALCDAALLYFDAARIFVDALDAMKIENFVPTHYSEIYTFVFQHWTLPNTDILNFYETQAGKTEAALRNVLNSSFLDMSFNWISHSIRSYAKVRKDNIGFLSDMLFKPSENSYVDFLILIKQLRSPLLLDLNRNSFLIQSKELPQNDLEIASMEYWAVLKALYEGIFRSAKFECPFEPRCTEKPCQEFIMTPNGESFCVFTYGKKLLKVE
jgi:hypothetical protein